VNQPGLVSLVLPCRNQADHIGAILPRYVEALAASGTPFELVVVPDASADATAEVVAELARREPRLRVVENPQGGWGRSVRTGLDAARGEVLAYTNTARTDPAVLPMFLSRYRD
jgi:glycosyltransferase involved in cell wall biosynthesis